MRGLWKLFDGINFLTEFTAETHNLYTDEGDHRAHAMHACTHSRRTTNNY